MVELPFRSHSQQSRRYGVGRQAVLWVGEKLRTPSRTFWVVCLIVSALACALPFAYDMVIRATVPADEYSSTHVFHIGLNVFVNVICLIGMLSSRGDLRTRLESAIVGVLLNFAVLMFVIMALRLYYSRPVLIVSFLASITLVTLLTLLVEKYRARRIGIIPQGITADALEKVGGGSEFVLSPDVAARKYDLILVDWAQIEDPKWMQFAQRAILSRCEVRHIAAFIETKHGRVLPEYFETDHARLQGGSLYLNLYKRIVDIALIALALPFALIILGVASLLILITMGRPILYVQKRLGMNGDHFDMYKLRSMQTDADSQGASATSVGDARVTPLGRILRRFRIDEIPQFYNILIGDMSLIGPRPEQPELAQTYASQLPAFQSRTMLRPGITGWAQVRGRYASDAKETEQKLAYDLYYLKYASFTTDLSIIVQTFKTLITGNSAR